MDDIKNLLNKVEQKENKSKRYIAWLSFLPAMFAIGLLYFTVSKINEAQEKLDIVRDEITISESYIDSLNNANEILHKRYEKLNKLFKVYDWQSESLKDVDSTIVEEAIKANNEILRILDSDIEMNYEVAIRYYVKRIDKDKIKTALRRTGYRDILFDNDSWRSKVPSNRICYDKSVGIGDVKLIALSLLREGVQIKKISLYPKRILERRNKANSIEIFGDEDLINEPYLDFIDIVSISKDSLLVY